MVLAGLRGCQAAGIARKDRPIQVEGLGTLIQVFDMPRSVAFYRDVLGFVVVKQSQPGDDFDWCLLRLDNAELMLNTAYEKGMPTCRTGS